jgi:2,4-diaminopentanoate dehydrogenase
VAKRPLVVRSGEIAEGRVAGMRFEWLAWSPERPDRPLVVFRTFWKMDDDLEPDWGYGTIKYSLQIEGEPSLRVSFEPTEPGPNGDSGYWGRVWTAMNTVNAIPAVCDAAPGIRTHLDLPFIRPLNLVRQG